MYYLRGQNRNNMIIDFNRMEATDIPNFKGGEKEFNVKMFWDGTNRIMKGKLVPGASIGEHTHEENCEILFVLEGEGTIIEDGVASPLVKGECTYCPKGHTHSLINTGSEDLIFFAAVPNQ